MSMDEQFIGGGLVVEEYIRRESILHRKTQTQQRKERLQTQVGSNAHFY